MKFVLTPFAAIPDDVAGIHFIRDNDGRSGVLDAMSGGVSKTGTAYLDGTPIGTWEVKPAD